MKGWKKTLVTCGGVALAATAFLLCGRGWEGPRATPVRESAVAAVSAPATNAVVSAAAAAVPVVPQEVPLSPRGTKTVRVTADRTMTSSLRRALADLGARVIAPVGPRTVLVETTPAVARSIAGDSRFATEDVLPAAKVQGVLADMCGKAGGAAVPITVVGLSAADRAAVTAYVISKGGTLASGPQDPEIVYADVPADLVASLAERGDVRWLEYRPKMKLLNDCSVGPTAANVEAIRSKHFLRGHGQTVCVYDSGFDTGDKDNCHLDFKDRVKEIVNEAYTKADYMGHGTHCAGTVLGDGARSDGQYRGAAPEAMLFMQSAGDTEGSNSIYLPGTFEHIFASCLSHDAYIQSDSWGGGDFGVYDSMCKGLDQVAWQHPELLVVVAAGNDGYYGMGTVSTPACAKNALTVGNSYSTRNGNPENLNISSSRGPTADHRFKPEIAAPGTYKYSTLSSKSRSCSPISGNAYYTEMTGTSMATPLVAGSAALVRQWLQERRDYAANNGGQEPTAALLKAILTGGGTLMTGRCSSTRLPETLPNNYIGWGRLNLENTLYPEDGRAVKFADRIPYEDGENWTLDVTTTNGAPLDVQLCWTDYPADASASQTIVNDLDLVVSNKATGAVWFGNGVTGGDHTNTVESVRIPLAEEGEYAIIVKGASVSYSSTEGGAAAVYVRGAFKDETAPDPQYVKNVRTGEFYGSLDEALQGVEAGDTLEIREAVALNKAVTISVACTITATNEDPHASAVNARAGLTVANGARVLFKNVVFENAPSVTVEAGGVAAFSGIVEVGRVTTADAPGIELAGELKTDIAVAAPGAAQGVVFGWFTCDGPTASACAYRLYSAADPDLGGVADSTTGELRWGVVTVPVETAFCVLENADGTSGYRSFPTALKAVAGKDSRILLKHDVTHTNVFTLAADLALLAETDVSLSFTATAGFVIPEGTHFVVSNLVICGEEPLVNHAFRVTGGEMTLEKGAELRDFETASTGYPEDAVSGATILEKGVFTMLPGSKIADCAAYGDRSGSGVNGGGLYAWSGTLRLLGGTITGCTSAKGGGGIYAWNTGSLKIEVAGDFTCSDNSTQSVADNLRLGSAKTATLPQISSALSPTAKIGLSGSLVNSADAVFANVTASLDDDQLVLAARSFSCDQNTDLYATYEITESATNLVWKERAAETGECDPDDAHDLVIYNDGTPGAVTNYYEWIEDALAHATNDCTIVMIDGVNEYSDGQEWFSEDLLVPHHIRLVSDSFYGNTWLYRSAECAIVVPEGASLTLSNIVVYGSYVDNNEFPPVVYTGTCPLIKVEGGALTLEAGSAVRDAQYGAGSYAASGVCVSQYGTFTMESGSSIKSCWNNELNATKDVDLGRGGGLLLLTGTAYLKGGTIENCVAKKGGALYVANAARAYVSGDFTTVENMDGTDSSAVRNNLVYDGSGRLVLAGEWTGTAGVTRGGVVTGLGTNEFGLVADDYAGDVAALIPSVTNFYQDANADVTGRIVTNATRKLLVWSTAVSEDGTYTDESGNVYRLVTDVPPGPSPTPEPPVTTNYPTAIAFKSIVRETDTATLVITDAVQWCNYKVFATNSLEGGFVVTNAAGAFVVEPATNFQWETTDKEIELTLPATDAQRFWKAVGTWGIVPDNP